MPPDRRGSEPPNRPDTSGSGFEEPAPAPVFVDQSGLRGRLLRGLGWPVSVIGAVLAVAMGSSLIGMQADAPAMSIPVQPSRAPQPSPAPASASAASPAPRTGTRSTSPGAKATAAAKAPAGASSAATPRATAGPSKASAPAPRPATTGQRGAKPSGRPTKQP
ncbi:hypothetical protein [Streptomyces sp. NRRL F-2664]|uniref:hypothetical protein n=1 Tax=Streptomyces sp. NRRL F-2664 TaxID=1463842 RepID=UPI0004C5D779|nr:hypothetical protein [Streptomyces sp. NRRL F-2664]